LFSATKGRNKEGYTLKPADFNKIEKALQNYVDALKNYYQELKSKDIISVYQFEYINKQIDEAYNKIKKTKTIYLPMGNFMKFMYGRNNNNPRAKRPGAPQGQQGSPQGNPQAPQAGQQNQQGAQIQNQIFNQIRNLFKFSDFEKSMTNIYNAYNNLVDAFLSIGLITKYQADMMKTQEKLIFEKMKNENLITPLYGLGFLINISGIYIDDEK